MKLILSILVLTTFCMYSKAQSNLVLNPSFENNNGSCAPAVGGITEGQANFWNSPIMGGATDYFLLYHGMESLVILWVLQVRLPMFLALNMHIVANASLDLAF